METVRIRTSHTIESDSGLAPFKEQSENVSNGSLKCIKDKLEVCDWSEVYERVVWSVPKSSVKRKWSEVSEKKVLWIVSDSSVGCLK